MLVSVENSSSKYAELEQQFAVNKWTERLENIDEG